MRTTGPLLTLLAAVVLAIAVLAVNMVITQRRATGASAAPPAATAASTTGYAGRAPTIATGSGKVGGAAAPADRPGGR